MIQQPLISVAQPQPQASAPLSGTTQAQTGIVNPQLGQSSNTRQQQTVQQPWLAQYQQLQFQHTQPQFGLGSQA